MSMSSNNIVSPPGTPVRPPMMTIENRSFLDVASHLHHPLRTHASSASLRSRELTPQRNSGEANRGGNVRVVVRVRGFLPRGLCILCSSLTEFGVELRCPGIIRNRAWSNKSHRNGPTKSDYYSSSSSRICFKNEQPENRGEKRIHV